jgi:hypothetical protein
MDETAAMTRLLMSVLCLSFAALSVTAMGLALRGAPAFDAGARTEGVYGDWRVQDTATLYRAPDYLFQLAYGYLQADAIESLETGSADEIADEATARARAETARALLERSLALAPADAHAWGALAWAEAMGEDDAAARAALDASWALAPWNLALGAQRVGLAQVLEVVDPDTAASEQWLAGVARDLETINRFGTGPMRDLLAE